MIKDERVISKGHKSQLERASAEKRRNNMNLRLRLISKISKSMSISCYQSQNKKQQNETVKPTKTF